MKRNQLIESEESQVEILESDGNYHQAKFLVTTVDVANRNGRTYPKALAVRETLTRFEGRVLGRSTHPVSDPDPLDHFLVFEKALLEGDHEYFFAKVVPTSKGRDFIELAKAGAMFSVSRRGTGELKEGTDKNGKKTKIVIPESYTLQGIDVLYPETQSDPNGRMIQFEAIDPNAETETMELTIETLREENSEIVTEIENVATQPLKEQVATLEGQVATLVTEKDNAVSLANESQNKLNEKELALDKMTKDYAETLVSLSDSELKVTELTATNATLVEEVNSLTERVNTLTESIAARNHLLEKVKGLRSSWLILDELKSELTVADVDAKFDEAKRRCDALIEHAAQPAGKTIYTADENSELDQKTKPVTNETLEKSRRIARHAGV